MPVDSAYHTQLNAEPNRVTIRFPVEPPVPQNALRIEDYLDAIVEMVFTLQRTGMGLRSTKTISRLASRYQLLDDAYMRERLRNTVGFLTKFVLGLFDLARGSGVLLKDLSA